MNAQKLTEALIERFSVLRFDQKTIEAIITAHESAAVRELAVALMKARNILLQEHWLNLTADIDAVLAKYTPKG